MKSLESIINSNLFSLEDDTIDVPQEEVTSDEYKEVVLDGISESATVEQFLMWSKNAQEHLRVLASISTESDYYRSMEANTLKKIGNGIADAFKAVITNFINFIKKTINYLRSIGIKKKCEFIKNNHRNVSDDLIKKHGKDKKFVDPDTFLETKRIFDSSIVESFMSILSDRINISTDSRVLEDVEKQYKNLKEPSVDAMKFVNRYCGRHVWELESFFTKEYERTLGKFNTLTSKFANYMKNSKSEDQESKDSISAIKNMNALYKLCINATGKWISETAFIYNLCRLSKKGGSKNNTDKNNNTGETETVDRHEKGAMMSPFNKDDGWGNKRDADDADFDVVNESFYSIYKM